MAIASVCVNHAFCQDNVINYFDQFTQNYNLINPAAKDTSAQVIGQLGNKTQTGLFKGVSYFYADGDLKVERPSGSGFHFFGFQFINNREGAFIRRNRVYGRYAWYQQLNKNTALSAGVSLGTVNYAFQNSQGGVGGSDFVPDGNLGVEISFKNLKLGASYQQFFNSSIRPVDETIPLKQYYNLYGNYQFIITEGFNFEVHSFLQLGAYRNNFSISPIAAIDNHFDLGLNYRHHNGLVFLVGIKNFEIIDSFLSLYVSYKIPTYRITVPDNAIELYLSFKK